MSLSGVLQSVSRSRVPPHVLQKCKLMDQPIVENITHLAQETMPMLDITRMDVRVDGQAYRLSIPFSNQSACTVMLSELKTVEAYSPARLREAKVAFDGKVMTLELLVLDETAPLMVSDIDIIRVSKRSRRMEGL